MSSSSREASASESESELEPEASESMSMIPYDTHRDVVLRHADSVVYFDPESRQLILHNRSQDVDRQSPVQTDCPACGRPFFDEASAPSPTIDPVDEEQPSFVNRDYFRMLARSLPGSSETSRPSSPRRRTIQPAASRLSSSPVVPPPDAEFVGSAPAPPGPTHGISETAFAPLYFQKFFVTEKELGKGGRGVVLLVRHVLDGVTLGHFACKRVPVGDDHEWLEKVLVEVQALQSLSHQNLVSYRHVWLEDYQINSFGPSVPCAFILQQYCNGGDLHNYVCGSAKVQLTTQDIKEYMRRRRSLSQAKPLQRHNKPKRLSLDEIYAFFKDITAGIRFLHLNGFVHRDLKPSNCLLHSVGGETRVLVSDFGEVQYENVARKSTGATGTISYCAPEVLRRETPDGPFGNFTHKSDVFSLGMILYFLCFADLPYQYANVLHEEREDVAELRAEIVSWTGFDDQRKLRPDLPSQLYTFLRRLLALDPDDRPSADDVSQGIRLGGLDKIQDERRKKSVSPEELTPGKRIRTLDSPAQGTSPQRASLLDSRNLQDRRHDRNHSPRKDQARSSHRHQDRHLRDVDVHLDDGHTGLTSGAVDEDEHLDSVGMQRSLSLPIKTKETDVVKQIKSQAPQAESALPSPSDTVSPRRKQFLLPAPPQKFGFASIRTNITWLLQKDLTSSLSRIAILTLKLLTALQPCIGLGLGMNASVLYPILGVAILELLIFPYEVWKLILSMGLHGSILWYSIARHQLCQSRTTDLWNEE